MSGPAFDIAEVLHARAVATVKRFEKGDVLSCAMAAATEVDTHRRAWALVALGGAMRAEGLLDEALDVLDASLALRPARDIQRAAFTCAAAIHGDKGDLWKACRLAEEQLTLGPDEKLLTVLCAITWSLWRETGSPELQAKWRGYGDDLERLRHAASN